MATIKDTTYKVQTDILDSESGINIENGAIYVVDNKLKIHLDNQIKEITGIDLTKTSDLINDGSDSIHPYITLLDLPSNLVLYATNAASDISTYYKLVTDIHDSNFNTTAVNISTGSISTTSQLIASLATTTNVITGNPGVFNITTIGNITKTAGSGEAEFFFRVYKRTAEGVETMIAQSSNTIPVINSGYSEFSATALWDDGLFLGTDRIVLKFYASRIVGGSNPTYQFQFGGISPVRTLVPIPLSVVPIKIVQEFLDNEAALLGGLVVGEFYHTAGIVKIVI